MLDTLREDKATLEKLLRSQAALDTDGLPVGVRTLLLIYANILRDGIAVLNSLIDYLSHDP
jgi:hypothetical protein